MSAFKKVEQEILDRLMDELTRRYQPFSAVERHMVKHLAHCELRLERCARAEQAMIDHFASEIVKRNPSCSMDEARALVTTSKEYAAKLKTLRRYQTSASRSCRHAASQLEELIALRKREMPLDMPKLYQVH